MADYAPRLDQRDSLTQRERSIIDRTLGMDEQLILVTRPDPSILKVELYIHFGIAALILMTSKAEPIILSFILPVTLLICVSPWLRKWNRRRTLYLVTDRRCIILSPRLLPGMKCESYALEPRLIKEHEIFNGGIGNIIFDYDGVSGPGPDGDDRTPLGKAIADAAEQYGLDPSAFASGLLAAVIHKKAHVAEQSTPDTPAEAPAANTAPAPRFGSLR